MTGAHGAVFRPELQGLRGIAILAVLLFHAEVPGASGGFVGVDVFFVLSGFLITGLLLREHEATGQIGLRSFYVRRIRRIAPAAVVVVMATLVAARLCVAPLDAPAVALDGSASILSLANIRFALDATDYWNRDIAPSPFLHFWSLGVEEQFYLLWPAMLLLICRAARPRVAATVILIGIVLVSATLGIVQTDVGDPWAFYGLPARAWQLALGGLLLTAERPIARLPSSLRVSAAWAGLFAIVASVVVIGPATSYPGAIAIVPTAGAAGLIIGAGEGGLLKRLLTAPPLLFLGVISFSLYLVHWPVFALPARLLPIGTVLPLQARIGLIALSVALAALLHIAVERPFHRWQRLARDPIKVGAMGSLSAIVVAALVLNALGGSRAADAIASLDQGLLPTSTRAALPPTEVPFNGPAPDGVNDAKPAPDRNATSRAVVTMSPTPTPTPTPTPARGSPSSAAASSSTAKTPAALPVPSDLVPALAKARDDWEFGQHACYTRHKSIEIPDCSYGAEGSSITVALVGDSHALQWSPALQAIAQRRHWHLLTYTKLSCPFIDIPTYSDMLGREYSECAVWRGRVVDRLRKVRPDMTIVAVAGGFRPTDPLDADPHRQGEALARLLAQIPGELAVLIDTPTLSFDVPGCLSRHLDDMRPCLTPRDTAFGPDHGTLERTGAAASGAHVIDLSGALCPGDPCPVVMGRFLMYRDAQHLTSTFSSAFAPTLERALPPLDGSAGPAPNGADGR
jgi:peptidoglycan/LPS O-acetylase OafA/YrhL